MQNKQQLIIWTILSQTWRHQQNNNYFIHISTIPLEQRSLQLGCLHHWTQHGVASMLVLSQVCNPPIGHCTAEHKTFHVNLTYNCYFKLLTALNPLMRLIVSCLRLLTNEQCLNINKTHLWPLTQNPQNFLTHLTKHTGENPGFLNTLGVNQPVKNSINELMFTIYITIHTNWARYDLREVEIAYKGMMFWNCHKLADAMLVVYGILENSTWHAGLARFKKWNRQHWTYQKHSMLQPTLPIAFL